MHIYHGTSLKAWEQIQKEGLKPRKTKPGNWHTNAEGNPELVYLTIRSPEFHAYHAALNHEDMTGVVLTLDLNKLDHSNLRIDENFLTAEARGNNSFANENFEVRAEQTKKALEDIRWRESLAVTGLIAHLGTISPDTIVDAKIIENRYNPFRLTHLENLDRLNQLREFDYFIHMSQGKVVLCNPELSEEANQKYILTCTERMDSALEYISKGI